MGGVWERLVGSIKRTLQGILKDVQLKDEIFYTMMTEIEAKPNSRLLTEVSVDANDPECLTPNHFLLGWSSGIRAINIDQPV